MSEANHNKRKWEEMNLEEKKDSFASYVTYEIAKSIKEGYSPFDKKIENFDRAYNAFNGVPYSGMNSLVLDIKQKEGDYQNNVWLSLQEARMLGAKKEEIEAIFKNEYIKKAKVSFIKTFELQPVYKLDTSGNKIPLLDEKGVQKLNKNEQPLFEYEYEPDRDRNGNLKINLKTNQPFMKIKTQRVETEPTLESIFLYNIDEFKTIDKSKVKPMKQELAHKAILWHKKDYDNSKSNIVFGDIENNLYKATAEQIKEYLVAQNNSKPYNPPARLNETQKAEIEMMLNQRENQNKENANKHKNSEIEAEITNNDKPKTNTRARGNRNSKNKNDAEIAI